MNPRIAIHPDPMLDPGNRKFWSPGRPLFALLIAAILWLAGFGIFGGPPIPGELVAYSQKAIRKRGSGRVSQKTKLTAPNPSTPASGFDSLGPPPPIPSLAKRAEQEIKPGDVISVTTTEVMLPVTVRDAEGRFATDLKRKDFRVFVDGNQQPLSDLALRQVPVDVVLMVDASSSVASNLDDFRRAAEGFAARLKSEDQVSLVKFDDRVQLLQDWTRSRFQLRRALVRIDPGMFTRFNDALLLAAKEQFGSSKSRRAVIVLSDGIDSGRGSSFDTALRALLEAQVVVYVVSNTEIARANKLAELDSLLGNSSSATQFNQIRIDGLRQGLRVLDQSEQRLAQ